MSIRTEEIARTFNRWLDRYSPPTSMKDKPQAVQDEADTLLRVLLRFAPQEGYEGWINRALDKLEYQMKTRAWPTKGELGAVCSNLRKDEAMRAAPVTQEVKSDLDIVAGRINNGDPVGDGWLYGKNALDLVASGKVSETQLRSYRSALFFSMRDVWGEGPAIEREAEMKRRHADAGRNWTGATPTPPNSPIKRMVARDYDEVLG